MEYSSPFLVFAYLCLFHIFVRKSECANHISPLRNLHRPSGVYKINVSCALILGYVNSALLYSRLFSAHMIQTLRSDGATDIAREDARCGFPNPEKFGPRTRPSKDDPNLSRNMHSFVFLYPYCLYLRKKWCTFHFSAHGDLSGDTGPQRRDRHSLLSGRAKDDLATAR